MSISPTFSMWLNILLAALTGIGTIASTDPTTQKVVGASGLVSLMLNTVLHALSSPSSGPVAKALAAPK